MPCVWRKVLPVPTRVPDATGLRLIVAIARHGSIAGAARDASITQQAASERLRGIEAQMGLTLVHRGARGSRLTPAGEVVAQWAVRLLDLTDEIDGAIDGLRGDRGRDLTVWSSMTIAENLLPRWLVLLRERQLAAGEQATTVSLTADNSGRVIDAVRAGTAQLGFVEGVEPPTALRHVDLARDELVLVTASGSPLSRRRTPLTPTEVSLLPLTSRERGSGTRDVIEHSLAEHDLTMAASVVELTTATAVREAVLAGGSPAFLSRRAMSRELASGHLVVVPTSSLRLKRVFRAVWVGGGPTPPAGPARDLVALARTALRGA